MDTKFIKYHTFYATHKDIIDKVDQEKYWNLKIRHIISLSVGFSIGPLIYNLCKGIIEKYPTPTAWTLKVLTLATPIFISSFIVRKYFLFPHLEYMYHKYSFQENEFDYLIEKSS